MFITYSSLRDLMKTHSQLIYVTRIGTLAHTRHLDSDIVFDQLSSQLIPLDPSISFPFPVNIKFQSRASLLDHIVFRADRSEHCQEHNDDPY